MVRINPELTKLKIMTQLTNWRLYEKAVDRTEVIGLEASNLARQYHDIMAEASKMTSGSNFANPKAFSEMNKLTEFSSGLRKIAKHNGKNFSLLQALKTKEAKALYRKIFGNPQQELRTQAAYADLDMIQSSGKFGQKIDETMQILRKRMLTNDPQKNRIINNEIQTYQDSYKTTHISLMDYLAKRFGIESK